MTDISVSYSPIGDLVTVRLVGQQIVVTTVPWAEWQPIWEALRDGTPIRLLPMPCGCCFAFPLPQVGSWVISEQSIDGFAENLLQCLDGVLWQREHGGGVAGWYLIQAVLAEGHYQREETLWTTVPLWKNSATIP